MNFNLTCTSRLRDQTAKSKTYCEESLLSMALRSRVVKLGERTMAVKTTLTDAGREDMLATGHGTSGGPE